MSAPHRRAVARAVALPLPPTAVTLPAIPTISVAAVLPWLLFAGLLLLTAVYFVSTEQGATSLLSGSAVHEWVHDGRHLLGFPCH